MEAVREAGSDHRREPFPWQEWVWRGQTPWNQPRRWRELGGLSVVIPVFNAVAYTRLCLESLRTCSEDPLELIVVDNGSRDETAAYLARQDDVRVIRNPENRGFAAACNQGAQAATRPLLCFFNNDALATPGWDRLLTRPFVEGPSNLLVAPRACNVSGVQAVPPPLPYQSVDELATFARQWSAEWWGRWEAVNRVTGMCAVMRREEFLALGGFDERFGLGNYEDDDLCLRVRQAGGTVLLVHDCYVHHFGSRTFVANGIDYGAQLDAAAEQFRRKWGREDAARAVR